MLGNVIKFKWKELCFFKVNGLNVYYMYKNDEIIINVWSNGVFFE